MEKRLLDIEIEHLTAMAYRYGRLIEAKNADGSEKPRQCPEQAALTERGDEYVYPQGNGEL